MPVMRKEDTKQSGLTLKEHAQSTPIPEWSLQKHFPHQHTLITSISLHCISCLPLCDWHFCHSGKKIPNAGSAYCWATLQPSRPSCTACCVLDCLQLRAAVSSGTSLWCSHLTCCIKAGGQLCLPPEGVWLMLWWGTSGGCYQQFKLEAASKHFPPTGLSQFYRRTHTTEEKIKVAWLPYKEVHSFCLSSSRVDDFLVKLTFVCLDCGGKISILSLDLPEKETMVCLTLSEV